VVRFAVRMTRARPAPSHEDNRAAWRAIHAPCICAIMFTARRANISHNSGRNGSRQQRTDSKVSFR